MLSALQRDYSGEKRGARAHSYILTFVHFQKTVGFDSGFVPVAANATAFPAWTIQVTVGTPLWFYCKQGNHCASGMVGSINAATTGNKTFADFRALAMSPAGTPSSVASIAVSSSAP